MDYHSLSTGSLSLACSGVVVLHCKLCELSSKHAQRTSRACTHSILHCKSNEQPSYRSPITNVPYGHKCKHYKGISHRRIILETGAIGVAQLRQAEDLNVKYCEEDENGSPQKEQVANGW